MLKVLHNKWNQSPEDLYQSGLSEPHHRTRERFMALYRVTGSESPTQVALSINRAAHTVWKWIKDYNKSGPEALQYKRTGGHPPFCPLNESIITRAIQCSTEAAANGEQLSLPRWTLKRLANWCKEKWGFSCSRETIRRALKRNNISWKKAKKLLNRADPEKRANYLEQLEPLLQQATRQEKLIVYIDEAHIHQDTDIGYGWSAKGERSIVSSHSPGFAKVTFYGIYYYNHGQVRIWPYPRGNRQHTVNVLERIRQENPEREITIIWDGASYHRAFDVCEAARKLKIELVLLPPYSPDFMPVEALWRWLREDLTYHYCYKTRDELVKAVNTFCSKINKSPTELADRLHSKDSIDETEEALRKPVKPKPK